MNQHIQFCESCSVGFSEKFSYCPNCATKLNAYALASPIPKDRGQSDFGKVIENQQPNGLGHRETKQVGSEKAAFRREIGETEIQELNEPQRFGNKINPLTGDPFQRDYGGIGRLTYFLSMTSLGVLNSIMEGTKSRLDDSVSIFPLVAMIIAVVLVFHRAKNIGASKWWALLIFVPVVNLWIGYRCLAQQEGFVETNELDGPGQIVRIIYVGLVSFVAIVVIAALLN